MFPHLREIGPLFRSSLASCSIFEYSFDFLTRLTNTVMADFYYTCLTLTTLKAGINKDFTLSSKFSVYIQYEVKWAHESFKLSRKLSSLLSELLDTNFLKKVNKFNA